MSIDKLGAIDRRQLNRSMREAYGTKPTDVSAQNVVRTNAYRDFLYRSVVGSWNWRFDEYLAWNMSYMQANLILGGGFAVGKYKGALVHFPFTVQERTIQHLPKIISSADGEIQADRLIVGEDCEIVTLGYADISDTMVSYAPILDIYAQKLANIDASMDINLMNCRTPFLFECADGKEAEDMKALYTRITNGEPAVYWRNNRIRNTLDSRELPITILPVRENYILDELITAKRSIVSEFQTLVGIDNVDYEKKERLLTGEITANNSMINCAVDMWRKNVKEGCRKVRELFGIELDISFQGGAESDKTSDSKGFVGSISDSNTK